MNQEQPVEKKLSEATEAQTNSPSTHLIAIAFTAAIVLTAVLVGGIVFFWQNTKMNARVKDFQGQIVVLESTVKDADGKADKSTLKKIYSPNEALYLLEDGQGIYDVYFETENRLFKLIDNLPAGVAGGNVPGFIQTTNPEIMIIVVKDADMGWSLTDYYYLDLKNREATKVRSTNFASLSLVVPFATAADNIELAFDDTCTGVSQEETICNGSGKALIKGLELNDTIIKTFDKQFALSCNAKGGNWVGCFNEGLLFDYIGISPDLSKIYFKLIVTKSKQNGDEVFLEENYSYDLKVQKILLEKQGELLSVLP